MDPYEEASLSLPSAWKSSPSLGSHGTGDPAEEARNCRLLGDREMCLVPRPRTRLASLSAFVESVSQ